MLYIFTKLVHYMSIRNNAYKKIFSCSIKFVISVVNCTVKSLYFAGSIFVFIS